MEKPTKYTFQVYNEPDVAAVPKVRLETALLNLVTAARLPFGTYTLRVGMVRSADDKVTDDSAILIKNSVYIGCYRCIMQLSRAKHDTYIGTVTVPQSAISGTLHETLIRAGLSLANTDWGERTKESVTIHAPRPTVEVAVLERATPVNLSLSTGAIATASLMKYLPLSKKESAEAPPPKVTLAPPAPVLPPAAAPAAGTVTEVAAPVVAEARTEAEIAPKRAAPKTRVAKVIRKPSLVSQVTALEQVTRHELNQVKKEIAALTTKLSGLKSLLADCKAMKDDLKKGREHRQRLLKLR